jgi:hypothetical protein
MRFDELTSYFERLERTRSRLETYAIIGELFRKATRAETARAHLSQLGDSELPIWGSFPAHLGASTQFEFLAIGFLTKRSTAAGNGRCVYRITRRSGDCQPPRRSAWFQLYQC